MDKAIAVENSQRKGNYRKCDVDERFMVACNEALRQVPLPADVREREDLPFIFIVGPPRSGTTLAMQLLVHCLDIGYVNNIMARFWGAPVHGARLSKLMVAGQTDVSFDSRFGVTPNLTDPHEFGYFWSQWLGSRDTIKSTDQVDWTGLSRELRLLTGEFGRPVAFKNLLVGCHVEGLAEALNRTVFVRISRDHLDNAISIARAREEYYGDRGQWWSLRTGYHGGIEDLHWTNQVAAQLAGIERMLDTSCEAVDRFESSRVVEIDYRALCEAPDGFIESVCRSVRSLGSDVAVKSQAPELTAECGLEDRERERLAEALTGRGLNYQGGGR